MTGSKENFENFDFAGKAKIEYEKVRKELKRPNILICGGTGAGKSTLINLALNDEKIHAEVNAGKPVTQSVTRYQGELITVFDSPGYESGEASQKKYRDEVVKFVTESKSSVDDRIHLAWYCISQGNDRILDIDIKTINEIKNADVPVAVIFTQADKGEDGGFDKLKAIVKESCIGVDVFETSQNPLLKLGVEPLLEWAMSCLPEAVRTAFVASAKVSIAVKISEGRKIVLQHIVTSASIAASPIPMSDAPLLLGNQAAMVGRLANIWNLSSISSSISAIIPGQVVSTIGRTLAGNLLKLFPGVGSIAGGFINAGIASVITGGIGYAINELFSRMAKDELEGKMHDLSYYLDQLPGLIEMFKRQEEGKK